MTRRTVAVVLGSITFGLLVVLAIPPVAAKNITADTAPPAVPYSPNVSPPGFTPGSNVDVAGWGVLSDIP
jgi:hypothetical protein